MSLDSADLDALVSGFLGKVRPATAAPGPRPQTGGPSSDDSPKPSVRATQPSAPGQPSPRHEQSQGQALRQGAAKEQGKKQQEGLQEHQPARAPRTQQVHAALTRLLAREGAKHAPGVPGVRDTDSSDRFGGQQERQQHRASAGSLPSSLLARARPGSTPPPQTAPQVSAGAAPSSAPEQRQRSSSGPQVSSFTLQQAPRHGGRPQQPLGRPTPQHPEFEGGFRPPQRSSRAPGNGALAPESSPVAVAIQMPSGGRWDAVRQRLWPRRGGAAAARLPVLDFIVVVEGPTDAIQVQRAVDAAVYHVGGSGIMTQRASDDLKLLASLGHELVVLTDPDREGNVLREHISAQLAAAPSPPARPPRHAFVPAALATNRGGGGAAKRERDERHGVGNVGIEHAAPAALRAALAAAAPGFAPGRCEFGNEELMARGLVNSFDAKKVEGAKLRRGLLCAELGVGLAGGSTLTKLLNRYFAREQYERALAAADAQFEDALRVAQQEQQERATADQ